MSLLADALFTSTQQKVLGLLYSKVDKTFYTKEIIRTTGMGVATIKRELDRMLAAGILQMRKVGNQHHYQANPECPIYHELMGIVRKTFGLVDVLQHVLLPLDANIDFAFVFGSIAKGEEMAESDIDVFIASESLSFTEVMRVLINAGNELGRPVNPSIYSQHEIEKKLQDKNAFLRRIFEQPKLWLKGSDDDIRQFTEPG